jgi:aminoglycoside 2'-N-acetyltransferase I
MTEVRVLADEHVSRDLREAVRTLTFAAFGDRFDGHDWEHTYGGHRVLVLDGEVPVAAAAVVTRELVVGGTAYAAGYVEGVATAPGHQGHGLGSTVMATVGDLVRSRYQLGALSTSRSAFYERLGWERWRGPTYVLHVDGGLERTPDEDDGVMVLRCARTADLDLTASISCGARAGDDW